MKVVVSKKENTVTVLEIDGRACFDRVAFKSNLGQILLKCAYKVPNGTVVYR